VLACLVASPALAADAYTAKATDSAPPDELKEPVRKLLAERALQVTDAKGAVLCDVWFRKEVPSKATPEQVKNGLSYRELAEGTLLGAVRFPRAVNDYRKQNLKPGVYTLRLGFQPENGDHMGTAPFPDFCLLVPAAEDKAADPLDTKALQELSTKASGTSHPCVLLLFPVADKPGDEAKMVDKGEGHWALLRKLDVKAGDQKAALGIALTLVGVSSAA
jgi:hypothetical protein